VTDDAEEAATAPPLNAAESLSARLRASALVMRPSISKVKISGTVL
jgi:hypothetical protein